MVDPHRLKPVPCPSSESCCQNRVMVRNMRRGQIFCLIPVTPCLWTTPGLGALPGKEMLLTRNQQRCQDHEYPKTLQESCFCTAGSQRSVRNRHQTVCTHSSSLLVGKTCSEVYLLYTARVESPGSTSCTVNQGIARLLLLAARQLWSDWLPSGSELMADDSAITTDVLSPVLLSTGLRCNGDSTSPKSELKLCCWHSLGKENGHWQAVTWKKSSLLFYSATLPGLSEKIKQSLAP